MQHPTRVIVDLNAITRNLALFRAHVGPHVRIMAVVKANAYGHGADRVAQAVAESGVDWLGVATLPEALKLRAAGVRNPILAMGYCPGGMADQAIQARVRVMLCDLSVAEVFSKAAMQLHEPAFVHVKIDTGMGRLGVWHDQAAERFERIANMPGLVVEGIFTHFSSADSDPVVTMNQVDRFNAVLRQIKRPAYVHAANTAATIAYPAAHYDMVRVGLGIYGMSPFETGSPQLGKFSALQPALGWHSGIASLKWLPAGATISYGGTVRCNEPRLIGVVPVGYGDGFRRAPHVNSFVLVRGQRAPIVGRICMDQFMVDLTNVTGAELDDDVVILGSQAGLTIDAVSVARETGTINYEVTTAILPRVRRDYI